MGTPNAPKPLAHLPEDITTLQNIQKPTYVHYSSISLQINNSGIRCPNPIMNSDRDWVLH